MSRIFDGLLVGAAIALVAGWVVAAEAPQAAAADSWCGREEATARQALATAEAAASNSAAMAAGLRLGAVLAAQERTAEAQTEYRRAVSLALAPLQQIANDLPARMREAVAARYAFGDFLRASGSYAEAETEFRWARDQAARFIGGDSPEAVRAAAALASLRYVDTYADELDAMARRVRQRLTKVCGKADLELAGLAEMQGFALMREKRFREALPVYRQMLAVSRAALPPDHPRLADALNRVASVQFELGQERNAVATLKEALAIRERAFGTNHPLPQRSRENLVKSQAGMNGGGGR